LRGEKLVYGIEDGSGKLLAVSLRASVDYSAKVIRKVHTVSRAALRLARISIGKNVAKAAGVIAITDDGDWGHRLVGDGPSKIRAAFFGAGFIDSFWVMRKGFPQRLNKDLPGNGV